MPVNTKHPQYEEYIDKWVRCRDAVTGEDAVKESGKKYLPQLSGQTTDDYDAYKMRAGYFNASGRTVDAMVGMLFRTKPDVTFQESKEDLLQAITKDFRSLDVFLLAAAREVLITSRFGVLVDADRAGKAPYITGYQAEDIINWRTELVNGRLQLSMVCLQEKGADPSADPFQHTYKNRIRVLMLDSTGTYTQQIWQEKEDSQGTDRDRWFLVEELVPVIRGVRLSYIPFVFIGSQDLTPDVDDPIMLDLVNVNLSLYRTMADLEHGRHFTALPTPWAAGFDIKNELKLGSQSAWVTDEPTASCGFLEFTGTGLGALENAVKQKKEEMAVLGVRMLETDKLAAEAADTHRLKRSGEASVLSSVARSISSGMTAALTWFADWAAAGTKQPVCMLNQDFNDFTIDPQMVTAMVTAVQGGLMSWESFFFNMQRGHAISEDVTMEDEKQLIAKGHPGLDLPIEPGQGNDPTRVKTGAE